MKRIYLIDAEGFLQGEDFVDVLPTKNYVLADEYPISDGAYEPWFNFSEKRWNSISAQEYKDKNPQTKELTSEQMVVSLMIEMSKLKQDNKDLRSKIIDKE